MAHLSEYARKRNEALFSLDYATIAAFYASQGIEMPPDPFMFWTVVCKCICNIRNAPENGDRLAGKTGGPSAGRAGGQEY